MTLSPEVSTQVLRGAAARNVSAAKLSVELRSGRLHHDPEVNARLADPVFQQAFEAIADDVRTAARAEGYAVGWAAGQQAAAEAARTAAIASDRTAAAEAAVGRKAVESALRALADAASSLEERAVVPAEELGDAVMHGALQLTEILLGYELRLATAAGLDALRRGLSLAPMGLPVTARLNPLDFLPARDALAELPADTFGREITLVSDSAVTSGGCVVECDASRVDAQLTTALARVRKALDA